MFQCVRRQRGCLSGSTFSFLDNQFLGDVLLVPSSSSEQPLYRGMRHASFSVSYDGHGCDRRDGDGHDSDK